MRRPNPRPVSKMSCKSKRSHPMKGAASQEVWPMKKYSGKTRDVTIGLDLGEETSYYVMLDGEGEVIEEGRIRTREPRCWRSTSKGEAGRGWS